MNRLETGYLELKIYLLISDWLKKDFSLFISKFKYK